MIEIYSRKIATHFSQIGIIPQEKIEVYRFYFEACCYKLITYGISVLIFVAVNRLLSGLLFLFVFMGLRTITGGYHTKKAVSCLVLSPLVILLNILAIKYLPIQIYYLIGIGFTLAVVTIFKWAPLSHKNNVLTEREISSSKKICKIWTILTLVAILLFWKMQSDLYIALEFAYISDALLLFLGVLAKERGVK